jgi:hypothetical protein
MERAGAAKRMGSDIHGDHFPSTFRDRAIWPLRLVSQDLAWLLPIGRIANPEVGVKESVRRKRGREIKERESANDRMKL